MGLNIQPVADHCVQENRFLIYIECFSESVLLSSFLPKTVNQLGCLSHHHLYEFRQQNRRAVNDAAKTEHQNA